MTEEYEVPILTPRQKELVACLMGIYGVTENFQPDLDQVAGATSLPNKNTVSVHLSNLFKKLDIPRWDDERQPRPEQFRELLIVCAQLALIDSHFVKKSERQPVDPEVYRVIREDDTAKIFIATRLFEEADIVPRNARVVVDRYRQLTSRGQLLEANNLASIFQISASQLNSRIRQLREVFGIQESKDALGFLQQVSLQILPFRLRDIEYALNILEAKKRYPNAVMTAMYERAGIRNDINVGGRQFTQNLFPVYVALLIRSGMIKVQSQMLQPFILTEGERNSLLISYLGITNPDAVAHVLNIAGRTVRNFRARSFRKLNVKNLGEAMYHALKQGVVTEGMINDFRSKTEIPDLIGDHITSTLGAVE